MTSLTFVPVPVDVRPGGCPNPLNVNAKGVLPVAILGTATVPASSIDPETVRLGTAAPLRWDYEDVGTPFEPFVIKDDPNDCNAQGPDGDVDLSLKFRVADVGPADSDDGDVFVIPLTGKLYDGTDIAGEDVVVIIRKK